MRIALLTENYFPYIDGVNISVRNLKKALELNGHEVFIVTYKLDDVDYSKMNTDHLVLLPAVRLLGKKGKELYLYYNLMTNSLSHQLDAYHFDVLHVQQEFTLANAAYDYAKRHQVPLVYTRHTMWETYFKTFYGSFYPILMKLTKSWFLDPVLKHAHEVIVPSKKMEELMDKKHHNDFHVLPTVIDPDEFTISENDKEEIERLKDKYHLQDKKTVLFLGRVSEEKRIDLLVRMMSPYLRKYPSLRLLIAGDGPYLETLEKNCRNNPSSSSIIFTGIIPSERRKLYYHLGDVFCTCSDFETQGLTYDEAMISSCPLLVKDDPVLEGRIRDEYNGFLFHDEKDFGEKLDYLMNHDLTEVKENAYKTITSYSLKDWGKDVLDVYKKAVSYQKLNRKKIVQDKTVTGKKKE